MKHYSCSHFYFRMPLVCPSNVIFWVVYNVIFTSACQMKPCTVRQYHFSRERDSVENHALCGYSFKNLTVSSHKNCFEHCAWDCRCISFNYLITANKDNCHVDANCTNTQGAFFCTCLMGYTGDGVACAGK